MYYHFCTIHILYTIKIDRDFQLNIQRYFEQYYALSGQDLSQ